MKRTFGAKALLALSLSAALLLAGCSTPLGTTGGTGGSGGTSGGSGGSSGVDYPKDAVTLLVPYGEGGGKDIMARGFAPYLEDALGVSIVVENRAGSSGAVGAQYVQSKDADGYTLYFGGESAETYQVMGMLDFGYEAWEPIIVLNRETPSLCVNPKSQFAGMDWQELLDYILAHPGEVSFGTTGVGSVQWNWMKLLESVYGIELMDVAYESGSEAITALLGGHIDIYSVGQAQVHSYLETGDLVPIVTLDNNPIEEFGCKCLGDYTDAFDSYLPYGSYVAVMAKAGTDQTVIDVLCEKMKAAYDDPAFQEFLTVQNMVTPVGAVGDEAEEFLTRMQSITCYLLYDTGELEVDPATYGIERVN